MHLLYVDESGDDALPENHGGPWKNSDFFIRTGIALHDKKWRSVDGRIRSFKSKRNIPQSVEIHAVEVKSGTTKKMVRKNGVRTQVSQNNWFGQNMKTPSARWAFLEQFLVDILSTKHVTVFSTVIDKKKIDLTLNPTNTNRRPKLKSLELISERFTHHISGQTDQNGLIIMDSVNLSDDGVLRDFQNDLYKKSKFVRADRFIESILFCPSHATNLVQLADVCCYAVWRKFTSDDNRLYKIIEPYMHLNDRGGLDGAGLKVWPKLPRAHTQQASKTRRT